MLGLGFFTQLRETTGQKCLWASGTWKRPVQANSAHQLAGVLSMDSALCNPGFGLRLYPWSRVEPMAAGVRQPTVPALTGPQGPAFSCTGSRLGPAAKCKCSAHWSHGLLRCLTRIRVRKHKLA